MHSRDNRSQKPARPNPTTLGALTTDTKKTAPARLSEPGCVWGVCRLFPESLPGQPAAAAGTRLQGTRRSRGRRGLGRAEPARPTRTRLPLELRDPGLAPPPTHAQVRAQGRVPTHPVLLAIQPGTATGFPPARPATCANPPFIPAPVLTSARSCLGFLPAPPQVLHLI